MAKKYLIVVDMQEDFIYGPLGNQETRAIVPAVLEKVKGFDGTVIFTKDTHESGYIETQEGRMLPVKHCIAGTDGWELIAPLEKLQQRHKNPVYTKGTFGCVNLAVDLKKEYDRQQIASIELIGVCTDICVVSNALLLKRICRRSRFLSMADVVLV